MYTSIQIWTHTQNSDTAVEAPRFKISEIQARGTRKVNNFSKVNLYTKLQQFLQGLRLLRKKCNWWHKECVQSRYGDR